MRLGKCQNKVYGQGMILLLPFIDEVTIVDLRFFYLRFFLGIFLTSLTRHLSRLVLSLHFKIKILWVFFMLAIFSRIKRDLVCHVLVQK
ncbi:unnamed protein product [Meloidogyne enterolobii]|uniref:Uncharacterized protein n=1 Tax=Meloidogyne enterolobii TaxID=390850 RepID=A0ACB1ATV4_MELEN